MIIPELIRVRRDLEGLDDRLACADRVAIDLETTGLKPYHSDIITGTALTWVEGNDWFSTYIAHFCPQAGPVVEVKDILEIYSRAGIWSRLPRGHNFLFDLRFYGEAGLDLSAVGPCRDTQTLARVVLSADASTAYDHIALKILADKFKLPGGSAESKKLKALMKKHEWDWKDIPVDILAPYARQDTVLTLLVEDALMPKVDAGQQAILDNEAALLPVLARMSARGIKVDTAYLEKVYEEHIFNQLADSTSEVEAVLGHAEIGSNPRLGGSLIELGLPVGTNPRNGNHYLAADDLGQLDHPVIPAVLRMRAYDHHAHVITGLLDSADRHGVVHTFLSPHSAVTGRFGSQDPNLQNIPRDGGRHIRRNSAVVDVLTLPSLRRAFVASPGHTLLLTDYEQMEAGVMADYANDAAMLKIVNDGGDVHAGVAEALYGQAWLDATPERKKEMRQFAKGINFSILYGAGINKLATTLHTTRQKAMAFRQHYFNVFEQIQNFVRVRVRNRCLAVGQVRNIMGRLYGVTVDRSYIATNYLVQGACADLIKRQMVALDALGIDMRLQIHDEIVQEVANDPGTIKEKRHLTESILEDVGDKLKRVRLRTSSKVGATWFDASAV
jgi:DNA polymerase-1